MKVGYVRVSTEEQNTGRQEAMMSELGVDRVYVDRCSGKNADRPNLQRMLREVERGDIVIVSEISRLARNTRDLLNIVDELTQKGVQFESQKEKLDTTTATGQFMLTIFAAVSQLEREYILSRQREGIALAKSKGVYKGRKAKEIDNFAEECERWRKGEITAREAMRRLNVKPNTFYRRVKNENFNA